MAKWWESKVLMDHGTVWSITPSLMGLCDRAAGIISSDDAITMLLSPLDNER